MHDFLWDLSWMNPEAYELHHGDCIGSDANVHEMVFEMGWRIVVHPPTDPKKRAWVARTKFWDPLRCATVPELPYLDRNKAIVDQTLFLLATPGEKEMKQRSGTWSTVRYAQKLKRPVRLLHRDGSEVAC
jgi:hypothetical protein